MKTFFSLWLVFIIALPNGSAQIISYQSAPTVKTENGVIKGINDSGVLIFKGIPFAQPPVNGLRWKAPKPVLNWQDTLVADHFGPRCMQRPLFGDMVFRSNGMSEDCLYLNIWTPAKTGKEKLPVLVYFYGGGYMAGDGSEPRYQGESMARNKGIISITVNYRLGVFGFLSHPALTAESPYHGSGDYGLMDQSQALKWVKKNIEVFGGDPDKITIAGESAGSISVSAQMASPLSKGLFRAAIGESGSLLGALSVQPLARGEQVGTRFQKMTGAQSLKEMRDIPADSLLAVMGQREAPRFPVTVDGYFLPKSPEKIFAAGEQAQVPLLVGWNSQEMDYHYLMGSQAPTPENYRKIVQQLYGNYADRILELYPGTTKEQVIESASDLAGDRFIAFSTWKWAYMHSKTGNSPVYRYYFSRPRPAHDGSDKEFESRGAVHSAEIEYAMGNLPSNRVYNWKADDYQVSNIFQGFFANFIQTMNPNGLGLPAWKPCTQKEVPQVMHINVQSRLEPVTTRKRYLFLNMLYKNKK